MKFILIGSCLSYIIFSIFQIQILKNKNKELSNENIVLNTTVKDQNNTISNLIKIHEAHLEALKNYDVKKDKLTTKYKEVNNYVKDTNKASVFLRNFSDVVDRLWDNKSNN